MLIPTQELEFLGFLIISRRMVLQLTEKRRQKIRSTCQTLLAAGTPSLRELASCIGSLTAAWPGVLPAPLHMRALQAIQGQAVRREQAWTSPVILTPEAEEDLRWWISHLDRWNGRPLRVDAPMMLIRSDAATDGGGGGWGGGGGGSVRFASNRRPLVTRGADLAYQRVGAAGCQVSRPVFCQDRGARPHRPPARQSGGG